MSNPLNIFNIHETEKSAEHVATWVTSLAAMRKAEVQKADMDKRQLLGALRQAAGALGKALDMRPKGTDADLDIVEARRDALQVIAEMEA